MCFYWVYPWSFEAQEMFHFWTRLRSPNRLTAAHMVALMVVLLFVVVFVVLLLLFFVFEEIAREIGPLVGGVTFDDVEPLDKFFELFAQMDYNKTNTALI